MTIKTHRKRKRRLLGALALGLAVAATVAPAAFGGGPSPDTMDAAAAAQAASLDGRSPDTLDAVYSANSSVAVDGWLQGALEQGSLVSDGRSADTMDAVSSVQSSALDGRSADTLDAISSIQSSILDGRSADTRDAAYVAHEPVVVVNASGFDWGDAGIGFSAALGIALLATGLAFGLRRHGKPEMSIRHMPA